MQRRKPTSTFSNVKLLLSAFILVSIVIGSQSIINSYPSAILITNDTKFSTTFSSISVNQITFSANQVQTITSGSVLPLSTGGYIKFKSNQVNTREALKFNSYQLNHNFLLEKTLSPWSLTPKQLLTNNPAQKITLSYTTDLIKVTTPLTNYYINFPVNSIVLISSDDNKILYRLSRNANSASITLMGWYSPNIKTYQID